MRGLIWWIWLPFRLRDGRCIMQRILTFDVIESASYEDPDVAWLGEVAWTAREDNMGLGLRSC